MAPEAIRSPERRRDNRDPGPLLGSLVGYAVRRANNRIMTDLGICLAPLGLRPATFAILATIDAHPGIIQAGVGAILGIQRANLVPLLSELAGRRLIERRPAPHDNRAQALILTATGKDLLHEASREVRMHEDRMLMQLDARDRETLVALLGEIGA
jgi:DNA-binding MarR family transcriptional regulator